MDERVVEKTLELQADVERVWRAITDPKALARWFPDEADFQATPGYEGAFVWDQHGSFAVRVDEADPPHRLVWSWVHKTGVPFAGGRRGHHGGVDADRTPRRGHHAAPA